MQHVVQESDACPYLDVLGCRVLTCMHGAECYSYQRQQGGLEGTRTTLRHLNLGFLDEVLYEGCSDGHHDRSFN